MLYIWSNADASLTKRTLGRHIARAGLFDIQQVRIGEPFKAKKGDVVLSCGTKALARLESSGVTPKKRKVSSLRGKVFTTPAGVRIMTTFDPSMVSREAEAEGQMCWDARLATRLHQTGSLEPEIGTYKWEKDSLSRLRATIEKRYAKTGRPVPVAMDLETMGLWPWFPDKKIVTSSWSVDEGSAYVCNHYHEETGGDGKLSQKEGITWLLTSPMVHIWGANLKFDLEWMEEKWGIVCTNFTFDVVLVGSLLDENRRNSLGWLSKVYTPMGGYDDVFNAMVFPKGHKYAGDSYKEHMECVPLGELLIYSGADADATLRVGSVARKKILKDKKLTRFYAELLHPAARAFENIERRGLLLDLDRYINLEEEVRTERVRLTKAGFKLIPLPIKAKYADDLKMTRPAIVAEYLFGPMGLNLKPKVFTKSVDKKTGKLKPSTSIKDHLGQFRAHPKAGPFIQILEEFNSANKTSTTYIGKRGPDGDFVKGFLSHLRPGNKFHPTYCLHAGSLFEGDDDDKAGTNTGRLSAKNPAVQTIPKHTKWAKPLRRCYIAPDGQVCWEIDFSQGELRVAACFANEPTMLKAYRDGLDIHAITAARVNSTDLKEFLSWKKAEDDSPEKARYLAWRQGAKAGNFGFLYAMGAGGFVDYAWKSYGVVYTLDQAEAYRDDFFGLYTELLPWHKDQVAEAKEAGLVRSPLGRIRHLPLINSRDYEARAKQERQAINSRVQGTLSDMCIYAAKLIEACPDLHEDDLSIRGSTHDSLYGYVREDAAKELVSQAAAIAGNLPLRQTFGWKHQIPFTVDGSLGKTMGDMKEFDLLAA